MAVFDCCAFLNENDLFEIRFKEHWDFVDKFIIIEAAETHTGIEKPFNFDLERFDQYKDKIIYITFDNFQEQMSKYPELLDQEALKDRGPDMSTIDWTRDRFQFNYIWKVLRDIGAKDTDIAYVSCADEIIKKSTFDTAREIFNTDFIDSRGYRPVLSFHYNLYAWKLNLLHRPWQQHIAGQMCEVGNFRKFLPATWRAWNLYTHPPIPDAGWHFTFLDPTDGELVLQKQRSWAHSKDRYPGKKVKFDHTTKEEALARFFEDYSIEEVPITLETHPPTVVNNLARWKDFIYNYSKYE